jgi:hypothetical protein
LKQLFTSHNFINKRYTIPLPELLGDQGKQHIPINDAWMFLFTESALPAETELTFLTLEGALRGAVEFATVGGFVGGADDVSMISKPGDKLLWVVC